MPNLVMAKTAASPLSVEEGHFVDQIERSLEEVDEILKELARERKEYARRNPPRPRIVEEIKALLGK